MVKAKDFWKFICDNLDYRFFSGVACEGLAPLYKSMNADFMHYVPAVNERIALGLVAGARMGGLKGCVLMDSRFIYDMDSFINFSADYKIPLLIIGYINDGDTIINYNFPVAYIIDDSFEEEIKRVANRSEEDRVPGLVVIGKGVL